MLAAFATLAFLIAMWLCVTVVAGTLEQSGSKIVAALKGRSPLAVRSDRRRSSFASASAIRRRGGRCGHRLRCAPPLDLGVGCHAERQQAPDRLR